MHPSVKISIPWHQFNRCTLLQLHQTISKAPTLYGWFNQYYEITDLVCQLLLSIATVNLYLIIWMASVTSLESNKRLQNISWENISSNNYVVTQSPKSQTISLKGGMILTCGLVCLFFNKLRKHECFFYVFLPDNILPQPVIKFQFPPPFTQNICIHFSRTFMSPSLFSSWKYRYSSTSSCARRCALLPPVSSPKETVSSSNQATQ